MCACLAQEIGFWLSIYVPVWLMKLVFGLAYMCWFGSGNWFFAWHN
jgi:hypothetical protein